MDTILKILTFLGAFLLFYVEFLLSKSLLPILGGGYLVWVGCVTFFTLLMLISNWLFKYLFEKFGDYPSYIFFFVVGMLVFCFFPINIPSENRGNEIGFIFWTLTKTIGVLFIILSSASLVIQKLYANIYPRKNPYHLYSISNFGSFFGLFLFPLYLESFLLTREKFLIIYLLYFIFMSLFGFSLFTSPKKIKSHEAGSGNQLKLSWIFLSSSATAFFLSTTNYISFEIGSAPFFWAFPLGIFLLSFILNFKSKPWRPKSLLLMSLLILIFIEIFNGDFFFQSFSQYLFLFAVCLKINQFLFDSKPAKNFLPSFYLSLSLGGAAGSMIILFAGPTLFRHNRLLSIDYLISSFLLLLGLWFHFKPFRFKKSLFVCGFLSLITYIITGFSKNNSEYFLRNYYGTYRVKRFGDMKSLINGNILHGTQDLKNPHLPLAYYGYESQIGDLLLHRRFNYIASIGLGVGNLLAYGKKEQSWDIIEIDPAVVNIAKKHFSYINNCPSTLNFLIGDGRVVLGKQPDSKYDLIILDAFSGDNIPFHLLTLEAIKTYLEKTRNWGLIAFHISNKYHDFLPLLENSAKYLGMNFYTPGKKKGKIKNGVRSSSWFFLEKMAVEKDQIDLKPKPWTDSYYNFWDTLRIFK